MSDEKPTEIARMVDENGHTTTVSVSPLLKDGQTLLLMSDAVPRCICGVCEWCAPNGPPPEFNPEPPHVALVRPPPRCQHKTRHAPSSYNKHALHTLQCDLPEGHDGAHKHEIIEGREVLWFREGPPPAIDYSTRFRFFKDH